MTTRFPCSKILTLTSTNERGGWGTERIVKRRVFHIQPLMKDWVKLYNPQVSYFTVFFVINIQIVIVGCLIKHTGFLCTDPTHGKVKGRSELYPKKITEYT